VVLRQAQPARGNVQVLTDPTGYPVWVSDVEPGSTHDITAARTHALPALYPAAAHGLPTLTGPGWRRTQRDRAPEWSQFDGVDSGLRTVVWRLGRRVRSVNG
jgi:hypothetical protein